MKVIRINWPLIRAISLAILSVYLFYKVFNFLTFKYKPTLRFNYATREFFVSRQWAQLKNLSIITDVDLEKSDQAIRFQIKSSLIKYTKVPVEYWKALIEKNIEIGLNTIEIEIVWATHEPLPSKFDFNSASSDLVLFIDLVQSYGLFLLVKIDPYYHCSDYDMGGLPSWLLGDTVLEQREKLNMGLLKLKDLTFKNDLKKYFDSFLWLVASKQAIFGGPIIGVVISYYKYTDKEEENASDLVRFYSDEYVTFVKDALEEHDIAEILLTTVTTCEFEFVENIHTTGSKCDMGLRVYLPVNDDDKEADMSEKQNFERLLMTNYAEREKLIKTDCYESTDNYQTSNEVFEMQNRNSNLRKNILNYESNLLAFVNKRTSFNIKNFFADINFGFHHHHHVISSRAINSKFLIKENFELTDKYWITYQLLKLGLNQKRIRISDKSKCRERSEVNLKNEVALKMSYFLTYKNFSDLLTPRLLWKKYDELYFEFLILQDNSNFHTGFGYMLYRLENKLLKNTIVYINTSLIRDYALVVCNKKETLLRINSLEINMQNVITIVLNKDCQYFDVIVENLGRMSDINSFNSFTNQRKGLLTKHSIQFKLPGDSAFQVGGYDWQVYFLDFNRELLNRIYINSDWLSIEEADTKMELDKPVMFYTKFNVDKVSSIKVSSMVANKVFRKGFYLMLPEESWSKGTVFVNNLNLGRYWSNVGPLCTLYIPDFMLLNGENEIIIFEMHKPSRDPFVYLTSSHIKVLL